MCNQLILLLLTLHHTWNTDRQWIICNDHLLPLFPFPPFFVPASGERRNMFKAAIEENSMKRVTLLMEHYQDEMSINHSLS